MKSILENKTFISTLNNLRISGDVVDINNWFDNITGVTGSYGKLIEYLKKVIDLEEKLVTQKFFKNGTINKIRNYVNEVLNIIAIFNNNCSYK